MRTSFALTAPPLMLAGLLLAHAAYADIYTWIDASGGMNVTNLEPPRGARVTKVVRAPPARPQEAESERPREAEVTALTERVRQLEDEIEAARRSAPPPAPPVVYPIVVVSPPPMVIAEANVSYPPPAAPAYGCEISWAGCALWWNPGFATQTFVGRPHGGRSFRPFNHGNKFPSRPSLWPPGGLVAVR
jgi:uncharacterized protein DUF4124